MADRWYVAATKWQREKEARDNLVKQGFPVFLPVFDVHTVVRKAAVVIERPLYPNYLFVAFDRDEKPWRKIGNTRGVARVLSLDNLAPMPLPVGLVEKLQVIGKDGKFSDPIYADAIVEPFLPGDKLLVIDGIFEGQEATFAAATHRRVLVVLYLLGAERKLLLPIGSVAKA